MFSDGKLLQLYGMDIPFNKGFQGFEVRKLPNFKLLELKIIVEKGENHFTWISMFVVGSINIEMFNFFFFNCIIICKTEIDFRSFKKKKSDFLAPEH